VILEPNARPGFTNRVLRPFVEAAACAYEETRVAFGRKGVVTGNPVRGGFARLPRREHRHPLTLLAFGGSQGSRALNRALVGALEHLPGEGRLRIVHQTGERMFREVTEAYEANRRRSGEVRPFLDDMEEQMGAADLVLSRSGATTCAELTVGGRAAVLVPFAAAADDHQRTNARALEAAGAARMIEEKDLTGESLAREVTALVDEPERIGAMEEAARKLGRPDAAARVADLVLGNSPEGEGSC
jgi:UDP-N-acetylglucosamine--N-acetylmuramyl-(pentapeptide) pyrophosphoryl-undecaprenol N-acetylglucosamine transferase